MRRKLLIGNGFEYLKACVLCLFSVFAIIVRIEVPSSVVYIIKRKIEVEHTRALGEARSLIA